MVPILGVIALAPVDHFSHDIACDSHALVLCRGFTGAVSASQISDGVGNKSFAREGHAAFLGMAAAAQGDQLAFAENFSVVFKTRAWPPREVVAEVPPP